MTFGRKSRFDPLPLILGGVTTLLLTLGFLQYQWTGDLSEAERARMRSSLQARANQLARELDREVTRAFLWLQPEPTAPGEEESVGNYAERYDRFLRLAVEPSIVKSVFLAQSTGDDAKAAEFRRLRYSPERRRFEPAEWPPALVAATARLRTEFGATWQRGPGGPNGPGRGGEGIFSGSVGSGGSGGPDRSGGPSDAAGGPGDSGGPGGRGGVLRTMRIGPLELLDDGTPVVVLPTPRFERAPVPAAGRFTFGVVRLAGMTVLELDRDAIVTKLLPRLEQRHFPADTQPAFEITVRRRDRPADVLYRSPSNGHSTTADARTDLLDIRPEELGEDDLRVIAPPGPGAGDRRPGQGARVFPFTSGMRMSRNFVGRGPGGRGREPQPGGLWSLEVAYRGGSVDALVAAARRRNLIVSFSVLILLGAATVLLAFAARRARRLAERQMEFVAAVSHELRTPVSVICSAGENLADGVIESREAVLRYGSLVRDEGRRLASLVEQVLDFAGTYAGTRAYRRDRVGVTGLVDDALRAADPAVRAGGFRVQADVAEGLPPVVGDAPALARALRNLVENAVKYGGEDRTVGVRARRDERRGRSYVRLTVEDHGLGIPAAEQGHLFEPFWRGAMAIEREIRGSGLGLALVRSIVQAHGGDVSVKSEPGQGSAFTIELEAAEAAADTMGATDERVNDIADPAG